MIFCGWFILTYPIANIFWLQMQAQWTTSSQTDYWKDKWARYNIWGNFVLATLIQWVRTQQTSYSLSWWHKENYISNYLWKGKLSFLYFINSKSTQKRSFKKFVSEVQRYSYITYIVINYTILYLCSMSYLIKLSSDGNTIERTHNSNNVE